MDWKNRKSHHKLASEMTPQEHFEYCEKRNKQQRAYRARLKQQKLQRTMVVDSLEDMCDLMCGGVGDE